jgi:hypothetical protein
VGHQFFKIITVYQGRNTGITIVRIPSTVEKGAETQNTTGGNNMQQRGKVLEEPYPTATRGER